MRLIIFTAIAIVLVSCSPGAVSDPVIILETAAPPVPTIDANQVVVGQELYDQYCGSCHGEDLVGEENWKERKADGTFPAPPHDTSGHTWHHPDDLLLEIIAQGGDQALGSTMPGFAEELTEDEMAAILEYIKTFWGEEERAFQWWITYQQQ
jgi:mono/diheme cytochrome c family protein